MPKQVDQLYKYFRPSSYNLHLTINKPRLSFDGSVEINGKTTGNKIRLHSKGLDIKKVSVNNQPEHFELSAKNDELIISPKNKQSSDVIISISFRGKITKSMHGMYPCYGRQKEVIIATQFESHHAREVFPCVDEPAAKAVFNLSVTTPKSDIILSNTDAIETKVDQDNKTTVFESTPKMSTYLLAFVSGPLKYKDAKTKDNVAVKAWATNDQINNVSFALDVAVKSLEFFNDYFEIPYPLKKCDLVALPDFANGAMENWGLLTFRETALLVDKHNTTTETKQYVAMVVAHELAHQWFGNLVTMKWWDDLWLNEGFASWIEFLAIDNLFPKWNMWTHFLVTEQLAALRLDGLKNTHPVQAHINHPADIRTNFDSISYAKGASVIHMLHGYLGENYFRKGLVHYLKKHSYSNTQTDDLWASLEEASKKPVKKFMSAWTEDPGYPLLEIKEANGYLKLNQQRFISDGSIVMSNPWQIPLNPKNFTNDIFEQKTIKIKIKNHNNLIANINHSGFYITKYWPKYYQNLAEMFKNKVLEDEERLGVITDMHFLNQAGKLSINHLFDIIKHLKEESSTPVWDIITLVFGDTRRIMGHELKEKLKPFILDLTKYQVDRLGWQEQKSDSYYDKLLRPLMLGFASSADNQQVVKESKRIFDKAKLASDIPIHYRYTVLLSVARRGGRKEFDKILSFYRSTNSPEDKVGILNALFHFKSQQEINRSLKLITSTDVRLQDVTYCLMFALSNEQAKEISWSWIKDNWPWLKANLGKDLSFYRIPNKAASVFSDENFAKDYQSFFKSVMEPSLELSFKQGLEMLKSQIKWRANNEQTLLDWLSNN